MPIDLKNHLRKVASQYPPLWIDAWSYGQQLLNKGNPPPWDDVGAFVSYHRQLQGLVQSDILVVEVESFYENWLRNNTALLVNMGEKRRLGYALRVMLADSTARNQLQEIIRAVCDSNTNTPVVLALPSPKCWMGSAHCRARNIDSAQVSWDDAESASMYVADFLRCFSDSELSGVLLRDPDNTGPASAGDIARYQPVINVAQHYHWQVILDGCVDNFLPSSEFGVTVSIGNQSTDEGGLKLPDDCWDGAELPMFNGQGFWYVTVPRNAVPEQVLELLAKMRATGVG